MKRKSYLGIFLMFITICAFSNKTFATENEIHVSQSIGSIRHDSGDEYYEGTGHSNWQFNLSLEEPEFTVDSDEALKKENPLRPRKTPYTYYGYSIKYEDNTYEQRQDRTLNYNELKAHEKELGKEISYVRIFYGPTSEIKVNYNLLKEDGTKELLFTDEQYGKFDVFDINFFDIKAEYYTLNELVSKYIVINHEGNKIKHLEEDQVIDIDLRLPKITIKYQDEQGETLKDSVVKLGKVSDSLSIEFPDIKSYDYTKNIANKINFTTKDQEIILIYSKKIEGVVNVRYLTEEGKEIAQRVTKTDYVGESYETSAKLIPGFTLVETPINAIGTYSEGVTTVDYIYKQDLVLPDIEGQVLVKYIDKENNEIASRTLLSGFLGESYSTSAKVITGYKLISEPEESFKNGVFTEGVTELTYQYQLIDTPVETIEGRVTVNFIDEKGDIIASPMELSGTVGSTYQTAAKVINGYALKSDSGNTTGHIVEGVQIVTYVYEKLDTGVPEIEGAVNVYYVDNNNTPIAEGMLLSGVVGTSYTTSIKEIPGYNLVKEPENATGVYTEGIQDVIYVYEKKEAPKPEIEGNVETKYVDETGKEIAFSESISGTIGTGYSTNVKVIPGYELVLTPPNKDGQIVEGTIIVTYVYKKIKTDEFIEGEVITKYIDEAGKEIALRETSSGKVDTLYTTKTKEIAGYDLLKEPENKEGVYKEGITIVTYVYKKINDVDVTEGKVIAKFVDQDGNILSQEIVTTGKIGSEYQTSKKSIEGYKLVKVNGKEEGIFGDDVQEVVYVYEKINAPSIITPITPVTPTVTPTKISNTGNTTVSKGELPKTGELENMKLSIIGLVLSMGIFSVFYKNYKKNEVA